MRWFDPIEGHGSVVWDLNRTSSIGPEVLKTTKERWEGESMFLAISNDGGTLYVPGCLCGSPHCKTEGKVDNGKKLVGIDHTSYFALGDDLVGTVSSGSVLVYEGGVKIAEHRVPGCWHLGKLDNDTCYMFIRVDLPLDKKGNKTNPNPNYLYAVPLDNSKVRVAQWNFRANEGKPIYVKTLALNIGLLHQTKMATANSSLFLFDHGASLLRIFDLGEERTVVEKEEGKGDVEQKQKEKSCLVDRGGKDSVLEVDESGQYVCIAEEGKFFHIYDMVMGETVHVEPCAWPVAISPDFTRLAFVRSDSVIEEVSLLPMLLNFGLGLCCSELPPYVILLIYDWALALQQIISIEAAERWHHRRKIEFIWALRQRVSLVREK